MYLWIIAGYVAAAVGGTGILALVRRARWRKGRGKNKQKP